MTARAPAGPVGPGRWTVHRPCASLSGRPTDGAPLAGYRRCRRRGANVIDHPEHVELTATERVLLDDIERSLAAVDPRLAERLSTHRCGAVDRWRPVRLPAGVVVTAAGLAGMVAAAAAGAFAPGLGAVGLAAAGTVALADELRERFSDAPPGGRRPRRR